MGRGAPVTAFVTFDSEETRLACLRKAKSQSKPLPPKYLGRQLTIKPVSTAALSPQRARVLCGHAKPSGQWSLRAAWLSSRCCTRAANAKQAVA